MISYAAFIRGIMPSNPNMRNDKLVAVFESLGLSDVRAFISSGNVSFVSKEGDSAKLEARIEKALRDTLGISGETFVRSKADLEKIVKKDPFRGAVHGRANYLLVTFLKGKPREVFSSVDMDAKSGTNLMKDIERKYGKNITSRSWNTVTRMLARLG